jgi:hypothetical protein
MLASIIIIVTAGDIFCTVYTDLSGLGPAACEGTEIVIWPRCYFFP